MAFNKRKEPYFYTRLQSGQKCVWCYFDTPNEVKEFLHRRSESKPKEMKVSCFHRYYHPKKDNIINDKFLTVEFKGNYQSITQKQIDKEILNHFEKYKKLF